MVAERLDIKVRVAQKTYDYLVDSQKRINLVYGGAGSAKSWQIGIFLILEKFFKYKNYRLVIVRKTLPSLRRSCWLLIQDFLKKFSLPAKINKSEYTIEYGGNKIFFCGLDDVDKLKSIESINDIWIEEATETTRQDYMQLNLRARGHNDNSINQIYLSFNPSDEMSYLKDFTDRPTKDMGVCHSTYLDNPFLNDIEREQIESLINIDEAYHKIYALGEWASLTGSIYTNWRARNDWPDQFDDTRYGLDFGYNNPTALIEINYLDGVIYLRELLYESNVTNSELIDRLPGLVDRSKLIVADSAEPDRIQEIYQADYDVHPCYKGVDSVRRGIDVVKSKTIYYHPDSENIRKEYNRYKWREDKDGNGLDEPVKLWDHALDAIRYGVSYDEVAPGLELVGAERFKHGDHVLKMEDIMGEDWDDWD